MISLIIADDEYFVLERIKRCIDYKDEGFELLDTFLNGRDAINAIREMQPDLAVLDIKMPFLTGLEIAEIIRSEGLPTRVILLTSYDYFEYARQAISYNVSAFLLKPVDKEELVDALKKQAAEISEEKEKKKKLQSFDLLQNESQLLAFLSGTKEISPSAAEKLSLSEITSLFFLKIEDPESSSDFAQLIREYCQDASDLSVRHILSIEQNILCLMRSSDRDLDTEADRFRKKMCIYLKKSFQMVYVSSEYCEFSEGLQGVYRRGMNALGETLFLPVNTLLKADNKRKEYSHLGLQISGELSAALKSHNIKAGTELIHKSFEHLCKPAYACIGNLELLLTQILSTLNIYKQSTETSDTQSTSISFAVREVLNTWLNCDEICTWCEELIEEYITSSEKENTVAQNQVAEVTQYIHEHYKETDLNVSEISGHVGYSDNYISSVFRRSTGISIVQYITKCRMKEALQLLQEGMSIQTVTFKVGYSSPYYFSRRFKQYYGCAPSEIQNKKRKQK